MKTATNLSKSLIDRPVQQLIKAKPEPDKLPESGYIRIDTLIKFLPLSKSSIWRLSKNKKFPQPIRLSEGVTAWKADDIHAWLASKEAAQ